MNAHVFQCYRQDSRNPASLFSPTTSKRTQVSLVPDFPILKGSPSTDQFVMDHPSLIGTDIFTVQGPLRFVEGRLTWCGVSSDLTVRPTDTPFPSAPSHSGRSTSNGNRNGGQQQLGPIHPDPESMCWQWALSRCGGPGKSAK